MVAKGNQYTGQRGKRGHYLAEIVSENNVPLKGEVSHSHTHKRVSLSCLPAPDWTACCMFPSDTIV